MEILYDRWRAIAKSHQNEFALADMASGQRWTFAQLTAAEEIQPPYKGMGPVVYPRGNGAGFIFSVLRAWRMGIPICPLEAGQSPPDIQKFPPECIHFKTTSATAAISRVVAFNGSQLAADADQIVTAMGLRANWPNLGVISLAHSYGFSNLVLPLLLHGIPLILAPAPLPDIVRQAVTQYSMITLPAVPVLWRLWHESNAIPSGVKLAVSAGAPLPLSIEQDVFHSRALKIHNFYGTSECGGITYDASDQPRTETSFVGNAMDKVHLSIQENGCLEVQSAAVGTTYWPTPSDALQSGCFRTSDLAEINGTKVRLLGRLGDQINVAGRKMAPESVERVIASCPGVCECLVFGVPSRNLERAEQIVACVVSRGSLTEKKLRHFVSERLPAWQVPRTWWFVDSLGVNQRGKLSRAQWRQRFIQNRGNSL